MIETYIAPRAGGHTLKILYVDGMKERTNSLRIVGQPPSKGFHLKVSNSLTSLKEDLRRPWDLVFHSTYLGTWNASQEESTKLLLEAFKAKLIRGVICTSVMTQEAREFLAPLMKAGVPCKYIPYSYSDPNVHKEISLGELFKSAGGQ